MEAYTSFARVYDMFMDCLLYTSEKRMFRIAICDDEKIFRDDLKEILIRYMTDRGRGV